jgi:hypothetical protein
MPWPAAKIPPSPAIGLWIVSAEPNVVLILTRPEHSALYWSRKVFLSARTELWTWSNIFGTHKKSGGGNCRLLIHFFRKGFRLFLLCRYRIL